MSVQSVKISIFGLIIFSFIVLMFWSDHYASKAKSSGQTWQAPGVTHIVMFEFRANASTAHIDQVCNQMVSLKERCTRPDTGAPYILSASGGRNNNKEQLSNGKSHAFVMEFGNAEDRDYYVEHDPVHKEFIESLGPFIEGAQVIDFSPGAY